MASSTNPAPSTAVQQQLGWGNGKTVIVVGPFAAGWADQAIFAATHDFIVDAITLLCGTTITSTNPSNLTVYRGSIAADTNIAGIISAGQDVAATYNLNTLVAGTPAAMTIQSDNNLLSAGEVLVLDTNTAASMVNQYIIIEGRYKR